MTLHKPSLKLTGIYLSVMVAISLFFSAIIYQQSVQELERGLRRPSQVLEDDQFVVIAEVRNALANEREVLYEAAKDRVLDRLLLTNLLVLFLAGMLSYYLARRTLKPIEEAHEALGRFTADASHELRTPLAAMQTETEVALMDSKLTLKDARVKLKSNLEELSKLTRLTEGLLRLARLENEDLDMQKVSVKRMVKAATDRIQPTAAKKNITIHSDIGKNLKVLGEETSLEEVLVVLLDNAVKYSDVDSEVRVSASEEHKQAVIEVVDQGIGIKATALPHIFDRFYRADSARNKEGSNGYGLGLAIAKDIIEKHDGSLKAESKPDEGSTFTISLPVL